MPRINQTRHTTARRAAFHTEYDSVWIKETKWNNSKGGTLGLQMSALGPFFRLTPSAERIIWIYNLLRVHINIGSFRPSLVPMRLRLTLQLVEPLLLLEKLLAVVLVTETTIRSVGATHRTGQKHARPALSGGVEIISLCRSTCMIATARFSTGRLVVALRSAWTIIRRLAALRWTARRFDRVIRIDCCQAWR